VRLVVFFSSHIYTPCDHNIGADSLVVIRPKGASSTLELFTFVRFSYRLAIYWHAGPSESTHLSKLTCCSIISKRSNYCDIQSYLCPFPEPALLFCGLNFYPAADFVTAKFQINLLTNRQCQLGRYPSSSKSRERGELLKAVCCVLRSH
jgi:hypothetical protein